MRTWLSVAGHALRLAWRADRRAVRIVVSLVFAQAFVVATTAQSQRFIVDSVLDDAVAGVVVAAACGALAYAVAAAGFRINTTHQTDLNERVDLELNSEILGRAARFTTIEHLQRRDYLDRLTLLRNHTRDIAGFGWSLAETAATVVSLSFSLLLLMRVHPTLGLLAIAALPPLWAARLGSRHLARARTRCAREERLERQLHELCVDPRSAKEIAVCGAAATLSGRADAARSYVIRTLLVARLASGGYQLIGWACYVAGYVAALVLVAHRVSEGSATLGDLVLVTTLGGQLRNQVGQTVNSFTRVADAGHAVGHYTWLVAQDDPAAGGPRLDPPEGLREGIALRNVRFAYPGSPGKDAGRLAIDGVSLDVPRGTVLAVVGANGAGKTTLVNLLTGMYRPTSGEITVDAVPLNDIDAAAWRARISCVFQDFVRFQLPVREAVGVGDLPRLRDDAAVSAAVARAGAERLVASLPQGLDTQLGSAYDGAELSEGQWQRLAMARAEMRRRPLLFVLDEPTAALDPQAEHELYERFAESVRERDDHVAVLVSHRFSTVQMADHIIVLSDGRIAERGSHEELMRLGGRYARMYAIQSAAYR